MGKINYDELAALDKAATPDPWKTDNFDEVWNEDRRMRIVDIHGWGYLTQVKRLTVADAIKELESNAALIVAMRNALPGMLAEMADLKGRLEQIRVLANDLYPYAGYDDDAKRIEKIMELSDVSND